MQQDQLHNELERQVERGSLFTHTALSRQSSRINEIESFLFAIIDLLARKGIAAPDDLKQAVIDIRKEMIENNELLNPGLALNENIGNEHEFVAVNCNERVHVCKAVCCKLDFALTAQEVESGKIHWDLGRPYMIRQEKDCYCTHNNTESKKCMQYENRPSFCKKYNCANDGRIWKDFDNMLLNKEWIDANIRENKFQFNSSPMFTDQHVANSNSPLQSNLDEQDS